MPELYPISNDRVWNLCLNLLLDDTISEVEANGPDLFFIKRSGRRIQLEELKFPDEESFRRGIETGLLPHIASEIPYDPKGYIYEGPLRYTGGGKLIRGRCHIVLPPAADSPQVTIAKKSTALATLDDIASRGSMAAEMLDFVKASIAADLTTILSGGTGAGKTTFLEAMCKHIPLETRIGVAEDTPELALPHPNATYLHSVPWRPGMDEKDVATLSWVVAQFNRMRTDKLIIGETRGKEFADFLVAANSGMEGSLTTIHANEPIRAIDKMTNFALKGSPGTPIRSINKDIATSIDLIFQLAYFKSDSRYRMTAIQEVTKVVGPGDDAAITTATLYSYNPENDTWTKEANPTDELRKRFSLHGINISEICRATPGTVIYAPGKGDTKMTSSVGIPLRRA